MVKVQQATDARTIEMSEAHAQIADAPERIARVVGELLCEIASGDAVPSEVVRAACRELADVRGGILGALASLEMSSGAPGEIVREVAVERLAALRAGRKKG